MSERPSQAEQPTVLEVLLERVRAGDNEAVQVVVDTYGPTILQQIRFSLHQPLRSEYDSFDVLQEVWEAFFTQCVHRVTFRLEEQLVHYLAGVARNHIRELHRRHFDTGKRNIRRQVPLDAARAREDRALIDPSPSPADEVACADELEHELARQLRLYRTPPEARQVALMLREGRTGAEIAAVLNVDERIICRIMNRRRRQAQRGPGAMRTAPHNG